MYKVFIENRALIFSQDSEVVEENWRQILIGEENGFNEIAKQMIAFPIGSTFYLVCKDPQKKFTKFFKDHKLIHASGGVVRSGNELLFIKRLGFWDLPKGKIEKGESVELAAVREVEEECGISNVILERFLCTTYHTYKMKDKNCLKKTDWFSMRYDGDEILVPQLEEDITEVKWINQSNLNEVKANTYPSILDVIEKYRQ